MASPRRSRRTAASGSTLARRACARSPIITLPGQPGRRDRGQCLGRGLRRPRPGRDGAVCRRPSARRAIRSCASLASASARARSRTTPASSSASAPPSSRPRLPQGQAQAVRPMARRRREPQFVMVWDRPPLFPYPRKSLAGSGACQSQAQQEAQDGDSATLRASTMRALRAPCVHRCCSLGCWAFSSRS